MTAFKIVEIKSFMGQLLLQEVFDNFLVSDIEIQTANFYKINGRLNKSWFEEEEKELVSNREYSNWRELKGLVYQIIKGNKSPQSMKLVFQLSKENTMKIVERAGSSFSMEDVDGLFLNLRYEKGELTLITGTSMKTFTLNKTLEQEWDGNLKQFLKHYEIVFEIL
ncbi:MAG: DUF5721 family protein [Acetivibrio sp.]